MSQIRRTWRCLFLVPDQPLSPGGIIVWWEARRLFYNLILAVIAIPSLLLFYIFIISSGTLAPGEDAVEPMALIVAPILANLCYTLGWILEIPFSFILRPILHRRVRFFSPSLFAAGLAFSLLVVLFPAVSWGIYCLLHLAAL